MSSLMVIIPDALSQLIEKGELTPRYYNPGDMFDEVHILLINADRVEVEDVQITAGNAKVHLHNLAIPPGRFFHKTLGWRPFMMRSWARKAVDLAKEIKPELIRCYGNQFNAYIASEIKRVVGIPYVVSLHTHTADNRRKLGWRSHWKQRLWAEFSRGYERVGMQNADAVIAVYSSLLGYTDEVGIKGVDVIHNVVSPDHIQVKTDYNIAGSAQILCVGRQFEHKDPTNIIKAVAGLECPATLTIIGQGPLHDHCKNVAFELGITERVKFIPSMTNAELCRSLPSYDLFVANRKTYGIPKAVIEPLLSGVPVIVNNWRIHEVEELNGDWVCSVEDTSEGYRSAMVYLLSSCEARKRLGLLGREYAMSHFHPFEMESRYVSLYEEIIRKNRNGEGGV